MHRNCRKLQKDINVVQRLCRRQLASHGLRREALDTRRNGCEGTYMQGAQAAKQTSKVGQFLILP